MRKAKDWNQPCPNKDCGRHGKTKEVSPDPKGPLTYSGSSPIIKYP